MGRMGILQRVVRRRIQDALQNMLRRRRLRKRGAVRIAIVQLAGLPAVVGVGRVERVAATRADRESGLTPGRASTAIREWPGASEPRSKEESALEA